MHPSAGAAIIMNGEPSSRPSPSSDSLSLQQLASAKCLLATSVRPGTSSFKLDTLGVEEEEVMEEEEEEDEEEEEEEELAAFRHCSSDDVSQYTTTYYTTLDPHGEEESSPHKITSPPPAEDLRPTADSEDGGAARLSQSICAPSSSPNSSSAPREGGGGSNVKHWSYEEQFKQVCSPLFLLSSSFPLSVLLSHLPASSPATPQWCDGMWW